MHPYPVQEYKVPVVDSSGRDVDMTRLGLAMHVAEAYKLYFKAAACAPLSVSCYPGPSHTATGS